MSCTFWSITDDLQWQMQKPLLKNGSILTYKSIAWCNKECSPWSPAHTRCIKIESLPCQPLMMLNVFLSRVFRFALGSIVPAVLDRYVNSARNSEQCLKRRCFSRHQSKYDILDLFLHASAVPRKSPLVRHKWQRHPWTKSKWDEKAGPEWIIDWVDYP